MVTKLIEQVRHAHDVSTPLVSVSTSDSFVVMSTLAESAFASTACARWDLVGGLRAVNTRGTAMLTALQRDGIDVSPESTLSPVMVLSDIAPKMPEGAVLFVLQAHRLMNDPALLQAIANLRDAWKRNHRMLILLGNDVRLPVEIAADVIAFDDALPTRAELDVIVRAQFTNAGLPVPTDDTITRAVDATQGLAAFTAEQATAMSLTTAGLNLDTLWAHKREAINRTPGLAVYTGAERFSDIGGSGFVKDFLLRTGRGKQRPQAIVFIDEIEKGMAGAGGRALDGGASESQHGYILKYMSDHDVNGVLFVGHPGCSKSMLSKALGNELGIPTVALDLAGAKDSLVGSTEAKTREQFKVIDSISGGKPLFIATCNSVSSLSPELLRRFRRTFFFDLPSDEERAGIWALYRAKYSLSEQALPADEGWTGADIANCAFEAWSQDITLIEASGFITPQIKRSPERIAALRRESAGRYLDASRGGLYVEPMAATADEPVETGGRSINFGSTR